MTLFRNTLKIKDLIREIHQSPPMCIYQLAKNVGRPYRRVHDQVHRLNAAGILDLVPTTRSNRRATLVISNDPYYERLLRLDDMYAMYREVAP